MSKYAEIQTELRDRSALLAALEGMGYAPEIHEQPQALYGYHDDERPEKAHIIIRRSHLGAGFNDVGYRREDTGQWTEILSDHHRAVRPQWSAHVKQQYAVARTLTQAKAKGYRLQSRETTADGQIRLVFAGRST
jgi:hypothetical protein